MFNALVYFGTCKLFYLQTIVTVMTLTAFNYTIDVTTKMTRFMVDGIRYKYDNHWFSVNFMDLSFSTSTFDLYISSIT